MGLKVFVYVIVIVQNQQNHFISWLHSFPSFSWEIRSYPESLSYSSPRFLLFHICLTPHAPLNCNPLQPASATAAGLCLAYLSMFKGWNKVGSHKIHAKGRQETWLCFTMFPKQCPYSLYPMTQMVETHVPNHDLVWSNKALISSNPVFFL